MSKRLTKCECLMFGDPEDADKPRCTTRVKELQDELKEARAALIRVLEWPLPNGTVETWSLPKWLAREARQALGDQNAGSDES